jgi:beta-galactosidase
MKVKSGHFVLGAKPFFLYSGEVHYFRIKKSDWAARLRALKAAGFNTVSSYIPWIWHEPEEGVTDFTGKTVPERDVFGFIDLAHKMGLGFSARGGPISNAELVHEGLPDWLLKKNPDLFVTGRRDVGNLPHVTIVSYLHPVFQEKVSSWYNALLPGLADRQVSRGGNINSVQLCNEIAMVHWLQKGADYKDHVTRMYRAFLEETYGTVAALNKAYESDYADFDSVPQPEGSQVDPSRLALYVDWTLFYRRYYATYYLTLSQRARERGIDVPLLCNIPQFYDYDIRGRGNWAPMTTSMFRDFPILTPGLVFGGAYQMRHLDFENFHDVSLTTEVTRMLGAVDVRGPIADGVPSDRLPTLPEFTPLARSPLPVVCAELQTGIMRDRPRLYPQQVELNVKSSVGQGLSGINAYMFAGGENPPGMGAFGTYHDWQAPVGPHGEQRDHLSPLKEFGRFLRWAGPSLAATEKSVDTTLGFYYPYYATEYFSGAWSDSIENQRTALWYDGMARLIHLAGYSVDCADLVRSSLDALLEHKSLWVYSLGFMDRPTQAKLVEYVRQGGRLVLGPTVPTTDLNGQPDTTLADGLGLSVTGGQKGNLIRSNGEDLWVQGPVQTYAAKDEIKRFIDTSFGAAVLQARAGKGQVLAVGFGLPHMFDHFRHWVRQWGESLGVSPRIQTDPWDLQASLRMSGESGFLFLFNYHFTEKKGSVSVTLPGSKKKIRWPRRGALTLPPLAGRVLPINIELGSGAVWSYSTAEVLDLKFDGKKLTAVLKTVPGETVDVEVRLPRKPRRCGGTGLKRKVQWRQPVSQLTCVAPSNETILEIFL